jgi:hypothetical protein
MLLFVWCLLLACVAAASGKGEVDVAKASDGRVVKEAVTQALGKWRKMQGHQHFKKGHVHTAAAPHHHHAALPRFRESAVDLVAAYTNKAHEVAPVGSGGQARGGAVGGGLIDAMEPLSSVDESKSEPVGNGNRVGGGPFTSILRRGNGQILGMRFKEMLGSGAEGGQKSKKGTNASPPSSGGSKGGSSSGGSKGGADKKGGAIGAPADWPFIKNLKAQFVPWGKHIPRTPDMQYFVATVSLRIGWAGGGGVGREEADGEGRVRAGGGGGCARGEGEGRTSVWSSGGLA